MNEIKTLLRTITLNFEFKCNNWIEVQLVTIKLFIKIESIGDAIELTNELISQSKQSSYQK